MTKDLWLPVGFNLPGGGVCSVLLYQEDNWQIYRLEDGRRALVVKPEIKDKWIEAGLMSSDSFMSFTFGPQSYYFIQSAKHNNLIPVSVCEAPTVKSDAIAFAVSLRESRALEKNASLHDAVYLEQYSRLLPSWTLSQRESDDVVLGAWLTGGVKIPVSSYRQLSTLTN